MPRKYLFIAILCVKMSRVNKALTACLKVFFITLDSAILYEECTGNEKGNSTEASAEEDENENSAEACETSSEEKDKENSVETREVASEDDNENSAETCDNSSDEAEKGDSTFWKSIFSYLPFRYYSHTVINRLILLRMDHVSFLF